MAELIATITQLSIADRIRLVQEILATITEETVRGQETIELSKEQLKEVEKRSLAITNGTAKTVSWSNIETALTERYGLQP